MSSTSTAYLLVALALALTSSPVVYTATLFGQEATVNELVITSESGSNTTNTTVLIDIPDQRDCGLNGRPAESVSTAPRQTSIKDWPWQAGIVRKADTFHFCGGAVITRRHILTAAHCLPGISPSKIFIRLGEYDFTRKNDSNHVDVGVAEIRSHELYDPVNFENDIAIIKLETAVTFNTYVQPVCLPPPGPQYDGTNAIVIGWGTLFYGGPKSDILMEVSVPVWEQKACAACFVQQIFDTNLCAAAFEGGKDSCQGDSGGPLIQQREDGRWQEIGVVSWGIRCAEKNKPGVYTRVNQYLVWILEKVKDV